MLANQQHMHARIILARASASVLCALLLAASSSLAQSSSSAQVQPTLVPINSVISGGGWNLVPTFGVMTSQYQLVEHQRLLAQVPGIDPDGDPISFSLQWPHPAGATIVVLSSLNPSRRTAEIRWQPPAGSAGSYTFTVHVSDGQAVASTSVGVTVLPADQAAQVNIRFLGVAPPFSLLLDVAAPTVAAAPFALFVGSAFNPGLPLSGVFGTGCLGLDPGTMTLLMNGLSPQVFNPYLTPFELATTAPPGLSGASLSFQVLVQLGADFFTSPVTTVLFP